MDVSANLPWYARELFKPYRHKGLHGGRGGAKSHTVAAVLVIMASKRKMRILCAREFMVSIKDSVKKLIEDKITELGLEDFFTFTRTGIIGANGSEFMFAGVRTNPDSIKSMEGIDICWLEEAQRISKRSLELIIPTIRKPGSEIWYSWNPDQPTDPVDDLLCGSRGAPPNSFVQSVNYWDNPWFPEVLRVEMEFDRERNYEKYQHVWCGQYLTNSEKRVFKNWRVEDFETPQHQWARFYGGLDFGFSIDPTAAIRCWFGDKRQFVGEKETGLLYIDHEAYQVGCEIDDTAPLIKAGIPNAEKIYFTADSSRPETISYLKRNGKLRIRPAIKGPNSVEEGIRWLSNFDIVIHPRCVHTINEFKMYSYKVDERSGEVLPILEDKDNHVIDATRYATEPVRRGLTLQDVL